jgi:hypothetical protein
MQRVILICLLLALFAPTAFTRPQRFEDLAAGDAPPPTGQTVRFVAGRAALNVPFELVGNLVLVQVKVNDSEQLRFVLDTGATSSVLDAERAKSIGLKPDGKVVGSGGGGSSEGTVSKGVLLTLPGVELAGQTIYLLPLGHLSAVGRNVDGVLGNDTLKAFVVDIDYARKTINFLDPTEFRYSGSGAVPLSMHDGLLFARVSVMPQGRAPLEANIEIDSGSTGAFMLNTPFVDRNDILTSVPATVRTDIGGVGGAATMLIGRVASVKLGQFTIDRPITRFSQASRGDYASASYDGLIGGEILRRFRVVVDYARQQLILEPNSSFGEPFDIDMSGIALADDNGEVLVDDVDRDGAAAGAGVEGGDILLTIDGRPAKELGLDRIRTMFMQDGKKYLLGLKRNDKVVQVKMILKRRI